MITPPGNSSLYKSPEGYRAVMAHYDAAFGKMGLPYETTTVETRHGVTHATVTGKADGKPLVVWHGLNAHSAAMTRWIVDFAPHYRVYAIDTIGGMGKSAPNRPDKTGSAYGEWAADALEALGLARANMIGVSNGGWLIVKLASVAPERIGSAVLVSTGGFLPISKRLILRMMPYLAFRPPAEAAQRFMALLSPPGSVPDPDDMMLFDLLMAHFRLEQNPPVLRDDEIRSLVAPTHLMMGQYEASFDPYRVIARGMRLLPNLISAEIVPGVGHMMVHPQPGWVMGRILAFYARYAV
jgi:pimeloyl-ACP methyl ester carboxylesterase